MGSECGAFDLESIAARVADKLVRRHPHVFGDVAVEDSAGVLRQWDAIKRRENGMEGASYLEGVGKGLPALMAADRLQRRAAKTGFDWPSAEAVLEKVAEETEEVRAVLAASCAHETQEELGDLLFSVVNLVRRSGFDAESLLSAANEKFRRRFDLMEQYLRDEGSPMGTASLEQMDAVWERVKTGERAVEAGC
jgi:MazG family protein